MKMRSRSDAAVGRFLGRTAIETKKSYCVIKLPVGLPKTLVYDNFCLVQ